MIQTLGIIFFLWSVSCSFAWTSKTYQLIVVKSTQLMPLAFRNVMLRHKEEMLRGCLKPDPLPEAQHKYDLQSQTGYLQQRILQLRVEIPSRIANHVPFRIIAEDFGKLAHYIADLNDPLLLLDSDVREDQYREDFAIYLEKNIDLFPWIFDGHEHPLLNKDAEHEYLHQIAVRAAERYPLIGEAYFPNGQLVSSDTFDPKSLPFGIASLSYIHSITHTVQFWFHVWRKAHGDTSWTPFFSKGKTTKKSKGDRK